MLRFLLAAMLLALPAVYGAEQPDIDRQWLSEIYERHGPKVGAAAPDFELEHTQGGTVRASALWREKPLMLCIGSYSCPDFRAVTPARQEIVGDFSSRLHSVVLYTLEAHPVGARSPYFHTDFFPEENRRDGILLPQPAAYKERLSLARSLRADFRLLSTVAVDKMDNAVWDAYGRAPTCAYLIDRRGRVVFRQGIFVATPMRSAIKKLLGAK